jgi:AraC family transcriptional regulator
VDASAARRKKVEAATTVNLGHAAVVAEEWTDDIDIVGADPMHHVQLSLMGSTATGSGRFSDRWRPRRFERVGPMFLLPANEAIHARSDCRLQRSVICRLNPDALSKWFDMEMHWTDRRLAGTLDIGSQDIRQMMVHLGNELRNPGFGGEAMVELIVAQLGLELSRFLLSFDDDLAMGGLAPWRLRMIDDYLAEDPAAATLSRLADLCNLSVRHLARAFRVSRGRSLGDYIADRRIDRARRMLAGGKSVKEAAFAAGFTAPTNFAAAFRRSTGETPREFQQRIYSRTIGCSRPVPKVPSRSHS